MKRITTSMLLIAICLFTAYGQDEAPKYTFQFGGFVAYSAFLDTYKSLTSREGEIYLFPLAKSLDSNGDDINESLSFEMLSLMTRVNAKITGPQLFGARTSAFIEGDFLSTSTGDIRQLRMRHAFVKLNWISGLEFVAGHTWHPMFLPECWANTPIWAIGVPFATLNRSDQLKVNYSLTNKITLTGAVLSNSYHRSAGTSEAMQANAVIPDLQFQAKYNSDVLFLSLNAGYILLKPRETTNLNVITDKTVGSYNTQFAAKLKSSVLTASAAVIYGTNLSRFVMLGGYGSTTVEDDYDYSSLKTVSSWFDIHTNGSVQPSLFAGYTKNLGAENNYEPLEGRGQNLSSLWAVSPYVRFVQGKMSFAFELRFIGAVYATDWNSDYTVSETADATINKRFAFNIKYAF